MNNSTHQGQRGATEGMHSGDCRLCANDLNAVRGLNQHINVHQLVSGTFRAQAIACIML